MFLCRFLFIVVGVSATVSSHGSRWTVHNFTVDPPATVGSGQKVSLRAFFTVPEPVADDARFQLRVVAAPLLDIEVTRPLCQYVRCPLAAGTYMWSWSDRFPEGFAGRVLFSLTLQPTAEPTNNPFLRLSWEAFATGTPSNETSRLIKWLYS